MNQKGLTQILTLGLIAAVLIAGLSFGYVKYFKNESESTNTVANVNENENTNSNTNTVVNANTATSEITEWLTYTNTDLGISFKYPNTTEIKSYDNCANGCLHIVSNSDPNKDNRISTDAFGPGTIGITRYATYQSNLEEFANSQVGGNLTAVKTIFANQDAFRISGILKGSYSRLPDFKEATEDNYFINKDNNTWKINFIAATEDIDRPPSYELFKKMISTFQFTD